MAQEKEGYRYIMHADEGQIQNTIELDNSGKKNIKLFISDYTGGQINKKLYEDGVGSIYKNEYKYKNIVWTVPIGTSLVDFFTIVQENVDVPDNYELRVLELYEGDACLLTSPYKFECRDYTLLLERGRYPKKKEIFLMTKKTQSCLPLIIHKQRLKEHILKKKILTIFGFDSKCYESYNLCNDVNDHSTVKLYKLKNNDRIYLGRKIKKGGRRRRRKRKTQKERKRINAIKREQRRMKKELQQEGK